MYIYIYIYIHTSSYSYIEEGQGSHRSVAVPGRPSSCDESVHWENTHGWTILSTRKTQSVC